MTKKEKALHDNTLNHYKTMFTAFGVDWDSQRWCLHHLDEQMKHRDPERYHEWNVEDVVPLTVRQHMALHMKLRMKGVEKTEKHREAMKNGHRKERRNCNVMIHRAVVKDGNEGIEAYVYPSCAAAAKHIGCTLQMVYQTASRTQKNRRAMGWSCDYVPRSVSIGKVAEDIVRSLVA